jgi:murein DD-endopeptidase MepM/ murein hydrolase activator NlpD
MEKRAKPESLRGLGAAMVLLVPFLLSACATVEPRDYDGLPDPGPRPTYFTVVVRPGDTLGSIGARYDVSTSTIAHMNDLDRQDELHVGEVLRVPAASRRTREAVFQDATTGPYRATHATVTTRPLPPVPPRPVTVARNDAVPPPPPAPNARPRSNPPVVTASAEQDQPQQMPASYGDGHFIWPLNGAVISTFGSFGNGERNDGINIAAKMGEPIHASAGGTVTYAGNELKGYGNLILIRHDDGYVTAYAHAQSIGVHRGDHVDKGQVIGLAGATGDVDSPQLHFEIRRGVDPVDPKPLLMADRAS